MNEFPVIVASFSLVFACVAGFRNFLFDAGILKQQQFNIPVILVGNLSVGGTGKTPHVEYLLDLLRKNFKIATISRGYGRSSTGFVLAGKGSTAEQIGDEPMQYHSKFEDVTVAVCENRVEGITRLVEIIKPDVIVMDDGYQHRWANPGFKILLTPIDRLFTSDHVLPAGDLREPRSGYRRADCLVVTRCDENMSTSEKEKVRNTLHPLPHQHIFFSTLEYGQPCHCFNSQSLTLQEIGSRQIILFSGIADATHLEAFLRRNAAGLDSIRFSDHHHYNLRDLEMLREKFDKFAGSSKILMTTEKDYQRLRGTDLFQELQHLPCYFIPIKVKIDRKEEFNRIIWKYVEANKGNS